MLPALFLAHGSPMNIIADNDFTRDMIALSSKLPVPDAIAVISAHWLTKGTKVTSSPDPGQIYDFYGFPDELYSVVYRAPGSPHAAMLIASSTDENIVDPDPQRGIDHAAWTILKYLFPDAKVPVIEISIDYTRPAQYHFDLGRKLTSLRNSNILFIGSGNIIHNLRDIDFSENASPFNWAVEFDELIMNEIISKNYDSLIHYENIGRDALRAIPFFDHYFPMLYILGMLGENERAEFVHHSIQNGSISMMSFISS